MKKIIITGLFFFTCIAGFGQLTDVQQKAIILKRMIEKKHYSPRAVDDSFSLSVFRAVFNAADPRRLLFTGSDYQQLSRYSTTIDNELQGSAGDFFEKFSAIYKTAVTRADSILNKLLQTPFDFTVAETLVSFRRTDSFAFATDVPALTSRWSRYLKYVILDEVYDAVYSDSVNTIPFKSSLVKLEPAIRQKVRKEEQKALKKITDYPAGFTAYARELYLDAVATCFDPHTNYFSPQVKEQFQAGLSTEAYLFGIVFDETESGNIVIDKLTPGGAAWKSGEINKGDELISLHWEGKAVQDMTGASLEEVFDVLNQSTHDKLLFRLKKADGTISNVFLRKEKSSNDENIVKSFVLKARPPDGQGDKKIGYILLPGFYTEWENETGSSCANDVAKEIVKLKRENIDGLILDVRYNGGGSVGEALDMIGIFIEEGPLSAEKRREGKLVTLKDPNRGTIYDGPMTLIVNGQSASASEMLAASLQDYNRAVITGSTTYGKATMQQMFPMDTISSRLISGDEKGDIVKITTGKLYRVNGQTAQLTGVQPDVLIPDAFDGIELGERFEKYPLNADTVKRNNYYRPLPSLPLADLRNKSAARVAANPQFQVIKKIVEEQQRIRKTPTRTIPLKAELFEKWVKQQDLDMAAIKGDGKPAKHFTVENHASDQLAMAGNAYTKEINQTWLDNLADDIYLQEVFLILTDLINLQKTPTKN